MHNNFSLSQPDPTAVSTQRLAKGQVGDRTPSMRFLMVWLRAKSLADARAQLKAQPSGFTLIEVMVAILILSMFIGIAMTSFSLSALLKVRARVNTEATNWIQQDLEAVRSSTSQINYTLALNSLAGADTLTLTSVTGLAANERVTVGRGVTQYTISSVNASARTIRLNAALPGAQAAGTTVYNVSKCTATTAANGYANIVLNNLPTLPNGGSRTIAGKSYTLTRSATVAAAAPFEVLQLNYSVQRTGATTPIVSMFTEVIPNVAFLCARN